MKFCPQCANLLTAKNIDSRIRYVCTNTDCDYILWNNPVPVVAALVKRGDQYIIARNSAWPEKIFSLITGYLEEGENVEAAVLREVKEELGLDGLIAAFLGHFTFKEKNQLIIAFEIHAHGSINTNEELAEIKELSAAELASYDFSPLYITEQIISRWQSPQ